MNQRPWYKHWQVWLVLSLAVLWWPIKLLLHLLASLLSVFH